MGVYSYVTTLLKDDLFIQSGLILVIPMCFIFKFFFDEKDGKHDIKNIPDVVLQTFSSFFICCVLVILFRMIELITYLFLDKPLVPLLIPNDLFGFDWAFIFYVLWGLIYLGVFSYFVTNFFVNRLNISSEEVIFDSVKKNNDSKERDGLSEPINKEY